MQLTKLSRNFNVSLFQMIRLTEITHFDVQIGYEDCLEELVRALKSMTNLQRMHIYVRVHMECWCLALFLLE